MPVSLMDRQAVLYTQLRRTHFYLLSAFSPASGASFETVHAIPLGRI